MKYKNAKNIFPDDILEELQKYVQGEYVYIPIKDKAVNANITEYGMEVQKRDDHIYTKSLEGLSNRKLSQIYCLSESSIRRIIINQRKKYNRVKEMVEDILANWNLVEETVKQVYDSAWQVGEEFVLKVYDNVGALNRNIKMLSILDDRGIPVSKLVRTKTDAMYVNEGDFYYILTEKLRGNNIIQLCDVPDIGSKMGTVIARLHLAFNECESQDEFWNNSLLAEMEGWISDTLRKDDWQLISKDKYESTLRGLKEMYDDLPVGLIHRDVHLGNFLFEGGEFSGYIDFDLSQRNIRLFDLCYFLLGLLSEEETIEISYDEWFVVLGQVFSAYSQIIALSETEIATVPYVMESIELLFGAWFIGQNDIACARDAIKLYEFVCENREKIVKKIYT